MRANEKPFDFLKNQKFQIPRYQRRYVWDSDNWERLLDEWEYGVEKSHFLGSVIIKVYSDSVISEVRKKEIVDGQQRLMTLSILYKVIFDLFSNEEKIRNEVTKNSILGKENDLIAPARLDTEDYKYIMSGNVDLDSILLSDIGKGRKKLYKSSNLKRCYKYFYERLSNNDEERTQLWEELNNSNKILFVVIEVNDGDDAQQIFDCINSAGVKLSLSELVKNKLMQKLTYYNIKKTNKEELEEQDYINYWENTFESNESDKYWSEIKSIGKYKRTNLDIFLYCFAIVEGFFNLFTERMEKLYLSFDKKLSSFKTREEIEDFCKKLNNCAKIYKENIPNDYSKIPFSFNDKVNLCLLALEKLDCTTFYPYCIKLLSDNNLSDSEKTEKFDLLLKLVLRVAICNDLSTSKNYNNYCYRLSSSNPETEKLTIEKYYNDRLNSDDSVIKNDNIKEHLCSVSNRIATLVLFILELYYRNNKDMNGADTLNYVYTLEHIMPQKFTNTWSVDRLPVRVYNEETKVFEDCNGTKDEQEEKRKQSIYSIGNMMLLTKGLNASQQNYNLELKMPIYKDLSSNLQVNRDFVNNVSGNLWNEETIDARTKKLSNEIINDIL